MKVTLFFYKTGEFSRELKEIIFDSIVYANRIPYTHVKVYEYEENVVVAEPTMLLQNIFKRFSLPESNPLENEAFQELLRVKNTHVCMIAGDVVQLEYNGKKELWLAKKKGWQLIN
jgi:hypothetical protein